MKIVRIALTALTLTIVALIGNAQAQYGWGDPMADMDALIQQQQQWGAQLDQYNQQMDAWVQGQMLQAQQQSDQAYAQLVRFFIDYYRQNTGDYATPDQQAAALGDRLWCQHNPTQCQQNLEHAQAMGRVSANGHAQNMANTQSWGDTARQAARTSSEILDMSHQGYQNRQADQGQGQTNYVQGAVYGESTFVNPNGGAGYTLPVYPDPTLSYRTPEGYPLAFDYSTNTWYQGDGYGWWTPLNPQR